MGLFDMKKLKSRMQEAAVSAATAVSAAADAAAEAAKEGKLPEVTIPDVKLPDQLTNMFKGNDVEETAQLDRSEGLPAQDALRVFYYLMSADGNLACDELAKFDEMCDELGKGIELDKDALAAACQSSLKAHASSVSPLVSVMACVDEVLYSSHVLSEGEALISPKLLLWDMLAIAYSDANYDDAESELIAHVAKSYDVGTALLMEMQTSILAMTDLEREESLVKTLNRPYLVIEAQVKEIEKRKAAVFEGVQNLIAL